MPISRSCDLGVCCFCRLTVASWAAETCRGVMFACCWTEGFLFRPRYGFGAKLWGLKTSRNRRQGVDLQLVGSSSSSSSCRRSMASVLPITSRTPAVKITCARRMRSTIYHGLANWQTRMVVVMGKKGRVSILCCTLSCLTTCQETEAQEPRFGSHHARKLDPCGPLKALKARKAATFPYRCRRGLRLVSRAPNPFYQNLV